MYINGKIQTSTALKRHELVYLHYTIMPLFRNGKRGTAGNVLMLQINSAYIFLQTHRYASTGQRTTKHRKCCLIITPSQYKYMCFCAPTTMTQLIVFIRDSVTARTNRGSAKLYPSTEASGVCN